MVIKAALVRNRQDLAQVFQPFHLGNGPFIIKPNWYNDVKGYYTDAQTLELLFQALPTGNKYVVEAHCHARNDHSRQLEPHEGIEHWDWLREQEQRYLDATGLARVLGKYNVEYINVSDELWAGRAVEAATIERLVSAKYGPVTRRELLGAVPQKLFDMSNKATFINLAKLKAWAGPSGRSYSLALKNIFGLIPSPNRRDYHGASFVGLPGSIVEINKIYHALFRIVSICEAIFNTLITVEGHPLDGSGLLENLGFVAASDRTVDLDAFIVTALGGQPDQRHFLIQGAEAFGAWRKEDFPALSGELERVVERMRYPLMAPVSP